MIRDRRTGIKAAWEAAQAETSDGGSDLGDVGRLRAPGDWNLRPFLKMAYDRNRDRLLISNGMSKGGSLDVTSLLVGQEHDVILDDAILDPHFYHVAFDPDSLDPAGSLNTLESTRWLYPIEAAAQSFVTDHNTGRFYACHGYDYIEHPNTGNTFGQDYGGVPFGLYTSQLATTVLRIYTRTDTLSQSALSGSVDDQTRILSTARTALEPVAIGGDGSNILPLPVFMDDIVAFSYGQGPGFGSYLYVAKLGTGDWISSRPIRLSYVLGMFPIGVDRFMVVGSLHGTVVTGVDGPLTVFVFRYDRIAGAMLLDDVSELKTTFLYRYPAHVGFMTFDSKRGALLLLSPDLDTIERHVFDAQCHPIAPNRLMNPVPVRPIHAGRNTVFVGMTLKDAAPSQSRPIYLDYGTAITDADFTILTRQFKTKPRDGTGTFQLGVTSAAEGTAISVTATTSSFIIAVSSTFTGGSRYGVEPVALQSETANFIVSATLSASQPSSEEVVGVNTVVRARRPALQSDAGGGTPRELVYPDGTFESPLIYAFNPQLWTNFLASPLPRPFYKETKTLTKTITTQFTRDDSDVEVVETWMGGGQRFSMPVTFFAALYNYYANPPSVVDVGYIIWRPRDLTTSEYRVVITNLEVGGQQDSILFDNYVKQGAGTMHDEVRLTFRIVEEV